MLYLNTLFEIGRWSAPNLTLTSVVFELSKYMAEYKQYNYLTLTSVVFEFSTKRTIKTILSYLTLTSVVFELTTV